VFLVDVRADKKKIRKAVQNMYDIQTKKINTLIRCAAAQPVAPQHQCRSAAQHEALHHSILKVAAGAIVLHKNETAQTCPTRAVALRLAGCTYMFFCFEAWGCMLYKSAGMSVTTVCKHWYCSAAAAAAAAAAGPMVSRRPTCA
jgi:ribosomal protein L23